MDVGQLFRAWWQEFYGLLPGAYSETTHIAFAHYVLGQPVPAPSDELVAAWSDKASGGGEATLAEADRHIANMAIEWARAELITQLWGQDAAE